MESWNKSGLFLLTIGILLVIYPYPNDFVLIERSHRFHGNLYQHYGVGLGLSAIVSSISMYTHRFFKKKLSLISLISGLIIVTWSGSYNRIQIGFLDFFNGDGFGYSKLVIEYPEMVLLQYLGGIIITLGFLGIVRLLPQNDNYFEMNTKSLEQNT